MKSKKIEELFMSSAGPKESASDIFERVRDIVAQQLGVDKQKVTRKANFANDLGADSLDTVELVMAIEDEFSIDIPDEAAENIATVDEVIVFIEGVVNNK